MEAPQGSARTRPAKLTAAAVILAISAIVGVLIVLAATGAHVLPGLFIAAYLVWTLAALATAWGIWNMSPWGFALGLTLATIVIAQALLALVGGTFSTNLVVGPLLFYLLLAPDSRDAFASGPPAS